MGATLRDNREVGASARLAGRRAHPISALVEQKSSIPFNTPPPVLSTPSWTSLAGQPSSEGVQTSLRGATRPSHTSVAQTYWRIYPHRRCGL